MTALAHNPTHKQYIAIILVICLSFFALTNTAIAQAAPLRIKYNLKINDGGKQDSKVTIEKDGKKWKSRDGTDAANSFDLDFQHDYVLSFTKPGYITKKIAISTKVPKSSLKDDFNPYVFDITIFKQYSDVNITVFNQPVAKVIYKDDLDDFGDDTDYGSSVLPGMQAAEKELIKKNDEEKKNPKPTNAGNVNPIQQAQVNQQASSQGTSNANESATKKSNEGDNSASETTQRKSSEGDNVNSENIRKNSREGGGTSAKGSTETDTHRTAKGAVDGSGRPLNGAKTEDDANNASASANMPDKRDEKEYEEGNAKVTEITITKKGRTHIYKKAVHSYSVFYFKDNQNITQTVFVQEAL